MFRLGPSQKFSIMDRFKAIAPVDVKALANAMGLMIKEAYLPEDISGMIEPDGASYTITVNARHSDTQKRFTIAHEIGHYVMHEGLIGDGIGDDNKYQNVEISGRFLNTHIGPKEESDANTIAVSVLMPNELLKRHVQEMAGGNLNEIIQQLSDTFRVSRKSMRIMLGGYAEHEAQELPLSSGVPDAAPFQTDEKG